MTDADWLCQSVFLTVYFRGKNLDFKARILEKCENYIIIKKIRVRVRGVVIWRAMKRQNIRWRILLNI